MLNFEVNRSMTVKSKAGNSPCRFDKLGLRKMKFYTGTSFSTFNILSMLNRKYCIHDDEARWLKSLIASFFNEDVMYDDHDLLRSWINWSNIGYNPFIEFGHLDQRHNWHKVNIFEKKPTHIGFYLCREAACFSNQKYKRDIPVQI